MENKKNLKAILIGVCSYMILSWIIVAGSYSTGSYVGSTYNQMGVLDILLAPLNLFNNFSVTMVKTIDGFAKTVGYGNIILAIISIGILYGVLNKTKAYYKLVITIKNKVKNNSNLFMYIIGSTFLVISALTGLELILLMFLPFVVAILSKLKYDKKTIALTTIGAMLLGRLSSVFNPSINGLNSIIFNSRLNDLFVPRLILLVLTLVIFIITLALSNKKVEEEEEYILLEKTVKTDKSFIPLIVIHLVFTILLFVGMYNFYYMFNIKNVTEVTNTLNDLGSSYHFMKNVLGMSESFGYFTGFTMSALLIIESIIVGLVYKVKLNDLFDGMKDGMSKLIPTAVLCCMSLTIIVVSLNSSTSFIYTIIDKLFTLKNSVLAILSTGFLHSFFINDYFALSSTLSAPITNIFGTTDMSKYLLSLQVAHGISSLLTPLNVYLIAGLSLVGISYTKWLKVIIKPLAGILVVSIIILFLV